MYNIDLDLQNLKKSGLFINEYIILQLIYEEKGKYLEEFIFSCPIDAKIAIKSLEQQMYIKIQEDNLILREKGSQIFKKYDLKNNIKTWIEEWLNLFPSGVKSGGYYVKSNENDVINNMVKFVKKYKYTKEQILQATSLYIEEFRSKNWMYISCADYFILKDNRSILASYCANLGNNNKANFGRDV